MAKKDNVTLIYVAGCSGKYWKDKSNHTVNPGDIVEFTKDEAEFHLNEPVWKEYKKPKEPIVKDGD
jgi:uncharacterized cupin superfamily protein